MTEENKLTDSLTMDMIKDAALYRMTMRIASDRLDIVLSSRVSSGRPVAHTIELATDASSVTALEEAVYDNPLLTADFHSVDILLDNNRFFFMHADEGTDRTEVSRRIGLLWPASRQEVELQPVVNSVEDGRSVLVTAAERPLLAFLRRTWNNPPIRHRMAVIARYHTLRNHIGNMGKIHIAVTPARTDLIVCGRDGLYAANTFATNGTADATFYALAAARHFDFDNDTDRILVSGQSELRDALITSLRRFIPTVLPLIRAKEIPADADDVTSELLLAHLV